MRSVIESIDLPAIAKDNPHAYGLTSVRMKKIGPTVVLAGANGSGKTRLMNLVESFCEGELANPLRAPEKEAIVRGFTKSSQERPLVYRVPQGFNHQQVANATFNDTQVARQQLVNDATNYGASLAQALRMAQAMAADYIDTGNALLNLSDLERKQRVDRWSVLQKLIKTTMGYEIGYDDQRRFMIDGKIVDEAYQRFSEGEKKLFSFTVTLAGNSARGREQIALFDEPETALHPEAAVRMIKLMQDTLVDGQLWIATHSIPLIAGLGLENVWFAERGSVSYGGRRTERVIYSLIGGDDNLFALRNAIAEPDRLAMARYAAECLESPTVVGDAPASDPQLLQLAKEIGKTAGPIRLLDWGCGNGRLKVWLSLHGQDLSSQIAYVGYDPDREAAERCERNIWRATGESISVYSDLTAVSDLAEKLGGFDFVIAANVLHEIDPTSWKTVLLDIGSLLQPDGKLLVLEDALLPVGELPNLSGFLLLDAATSSILFSATEGDIISQKSGSDGHLGRLTCLRIKKAAIDRVTVATVLACLESIRARALREITATRQQALSHSSKTDYERGHRHALAVMQFANANVAIQQITAQASQ